MSISRLLIPLLLAALAAGPVVAAEAGAIFEKQVRPLFEAKCFDCHSSRSEELKGNLKLDSLEEILKGGASGPAINPGDLENSFLLRAIRYEEADYQMPPSGRMSDEAIAAVEKWVQALADEAKRPARANSPRP